MRTEQEDMSIVDSSTLMDFEESLERYRRTADPSAEGCCDGGLF